MTTELRFRLTGTRPLLMHNGRMADPTNPTTRELRLLTSKKKKTDLDFAEIKRLEWLAGLYLDENGRVAISDDMLLGVIVAGARKSAEGKLALAAVMPTAAFFPIEHKGPVDLMELYDAGKFCDYRAVSVQRARVMRARPRFNQWTVGVGIMLDESVFNERALVASLEKGGSQLGIGDYRPRFGRFTVARV